jgi:raffinose/stachyose/melibiose transport system substrate-binding protein
MQAYTSEHLIRERIMPHLGVAKADFKPKMRRMLLLLAVPILFLLVILIIGLILTPRDMPSDGDVTARNADSTSQNLAGEPAQTVESITLANNRVEIDDALAAYAADYSQHAGLSVKVMTISGSADYNETLKVQLKAGNFPDIFVIEGPSGYALWQERIADLSGETWVRDTTYCYYDQSGRAVGFPVAIEGYGLAYNQDLLSRAGIDPATLTNFAGTKTAFEKLDKIKKDLGIKAVVAMSISGKNGMSWVSSLANFNVYLSGGLSYGNTIALNEVLKGQIEANRLAQYAEYVNLLFKYADPQMLLNGSYDDQAQAFAAGQTVFIQDGNWLDPTLVNRGANFAMAYAPLGAYGPSTDGVFVAPTAWYCVDQQSAGSAEARKFLTAMATTDAGQRYMVETAGLIPAFKSVQLSPQLPLARSIKNWSDAGKVYSIMQDRLPAGFGIDALGPIYEQLAAGTINPVQFSAQLATAIQSLTGNQPGPAQTQTAPSQTTKNPPKQTQATTRQTTLPTTTQTPVIIGQ